MHRCREALERDFPADLVGAPEELRELGGDGEVVAAAEEHPAVTFSVCSAASLSAPPGPRRSGHDLVDGEGRRKSQQRTARQPARAADACHLQRGAHLTPEDAGAFQGCTSWPQAGGVHGRTDDAGPLSPGALLRSRAQVLLRQRDRVASRTSRSSGAPTRSSTSERRASERRLTRLGVKRGDRVATSPGTTAVTSRHTFAIPLCGAVLHTLNPRLSVYRTSPTSSTMRTTRGPGGRLPVAALGAHPARGEAAAGGSGTWSSRPGRRHRL